MDKPLTTKATRQLDNIRSRYIVLQKHVMRSNLRLVYGIALKYENMGLDMNDLILEGFKGLQKAMERYNVHKGYTFRTYAYPWIQEHIRYALADSLPISLPHHVHRLLMKVQDIRSRLYLSNGGREPSDADLSAELGLTSERFEVVKRAIALAERSSEHPATSSLAASPASPDRVAQVHFDEATWEEVKSAYGEANPIELVTSPLGEVDSDGMGTGGVSYTSDESSERVYGFSKNDVRHAVLSVLDILPPEEAAAIYQRLGLADFDADDQYQQANVKSKFISILAPAPAPATPSGSSSRSIATATAGISGASPSSNRRKTPSLAEANALYHKGVRRLRRRLAVSDASMGKKYPEVQALKEAFTTPLG
eukprot:CAMPEP_0174964062 /NCGR_PEP_ID=MMETSP0004_2-20121128/5671_1 /TAXON_ID=420556 /ORGANISM="Ochromonas sp., Strain CCMP1393" /LENGTH=366 /DNA_ID=CAMNT_0016212745 /DNA_START=321 /DNA_END=1421 /DNA_ORIENTATION=-